MTIRLITARDEYILVTKLDDRRRGGPLRLTIVDTDWSIVSIYPLIIEGRKADAGEGFVIVALD